MIRALIFVLLAGCAADAGEPPRYRPELQPLFLNQFMQLEIYANCKRYSEAVYQDMINGMNMVHPEASNKEATAFEYMKEAFIDCYKPYQRT